MIYLEYAFIYSDGKKVKVIKGDIPDPTNKDTGLTRNFHRKKVIPLLEE